MEERSKIMGRIGKMVLVAAALAFLALGCGKSGEDQHEGGHEEHEHGAASSPEASEIVQKTCPIMEGRMIDPKLFVDYKGRRIYLCCPSCVATFKKDPAKYIKKVDEEIAKSKGI